MGLLKNIKVSEGRFINQTDINEKRKVIIISSTHKKIFFTADKEAIGAYLKFKNTLCLIVGVYDDTFNNMETEDYHIANNLVLGLTFFIWIIGISTLLSGIMGINNITMISVRERTKEFAIRRTLGAKPFTIIKSVLIESTFVTLVFGYLGVFFSVLILHLTSRIFSTVGSEGFMSLLSRPAVDVNIVVSASLLLVIVGIASGFYPAKKALSLSIIEAINKE